MNISRRIIRSSTILSRFTSPQCTSVFCTRNVGAYQGHGKTVVEVMHKNITDYHMITSYSQLGFRLENGVFVVGPMIIHNKTVLGWNIKNDDAITEDSLEFFRHVYPPLDLLILGLSEDKSLGKFNKELIIAFRKLNLPLEILPTVKALQTYNFIAGIRNVAGAFLPPRRFVLSTGDYLKHRLRHDMVLGPDVRDRHENSIREQAKRMGIKEN